jgi:hypothetical protein
MCCILMLYLLFFRLLYLFVYNISISRVSIFSIFLNFFARENTSISLLLKRVKARQFYRFTFGPPPPRLHSCRAFTPHSRPPTIFSAPVTAHAATHRHPSFPSPPSTRRRLPRRSAWRTPNYPSLPGSVCPAADLVVWRLSRDRR